jgi:phosphoserine phosphatase RsbU/P
VESGEAVGLACLEVWGGNEGVDRGLRVPGLEVWVYAAPYEDAAAGGDVHFVSSCGTGRIARLVVADVAGHGEAVAETGRMLRGLVRRFMNHIDQRGFVRAMNQRFTELGKAGRFATAVAMTYFSPAGELSVCNAGHPLPMIYRKRTGKWEYLEGGPAAEAGAELENIPLGIEGAASYEQFEVRLEEGDLVLCYTDSLMEAVCGDGSLLGTERLLELVRGVPAEGREVIHGLLKKMGEAGAVLNDDVTLMVVRCLGRSGGVGFLKRLGAQVKFLGEVVRMKRDIPWPEWSWRNLGGAVVGNRRR